MFFEQKKTPVEEAEENVENAQKRLDQHVQDGLKACDWNSRIYNQELEMHQRSLQRANEALKAAMAAARSTSSITPKK